MNYMRVYIAYKYRAIEDKNQLKQDLQRVSDAIEHLQHRPFVLGRDIQKWHSSSSSVFRTIPHILINIIKSDIVFAFINTSAKSWGLKFEMLCCKILGKPVIVAIKAGVAFELQGIKPTATIEFSDVDDLVSKINTLSI